MKRKYSVIVFDLGNVLLPFDFKDVIIKLERVEAGLGMKFADYYRNNYDIHRRFERGGYSVDEFTEIMLDVLDQKVGREEFYKIYSELFTVNRELASILPALRRNYRLVIMSNTNAIHYQYGWKDYEFLEHFEKLILSYEIGAVKPEEKIYKVVEAYTGALSDEHFYIDDILEYVTAARAIGWDAVQFVGNQELFQEFEKRGIVFDKNSRD